MTVFDCANKATDGFSYHFAIMMHMHTHTTEAISAPSVAPCLWLSKTEMTLLDAIDSATVYGVWTRIPETLYLAQQLVQPTLGAPQPARAHPCFCIQDHFSVR